MTERPKPLPGEQVGGPPAKSEADHFYVCKQCKQAVDKRDLAQVIHHMRRGHDPLEMHS